ncbi:MAG: hypothetical protein ACC608_00530 [Anaerofustis sp.]
MIKFVIFTEIILLCNLKQARKRLLFLVCLLTAKNLNKLSDADLKKVGDAVTNAYAETVKADPNLHVTDAQIEAYKKQSKKNMGSRENAISEILAKTDELKTSFSNQIEAAKGKAKEAGIEVDETASNKALQGDGDGGRINTNIKEHGQLDAEENVYPHGANSLTLDSKANDYVTYRRVQGGSGSKSSQERIIIKNDGTVYITNKDKNLNISIDEGEHAEYFINKREGSYVVEFDVPKWFDEYIKENAVPQEGYKSNPDNQGGFAPKITDPSTPGISVELPPPWIEWIEEYAINARIIKK